MSVIVRGKVALIGECLSNSILSRIVSSHCVPFSSNIGDCKVGKTAMTTVVSKQGKQFPKKYEMVYV